MKMNHRINPLQHQPLPLQPKTVEKQPVRDKSFQSFSKEAQTEQPLKISKHAQKRLDERNIHINETEWTNIQEKLSHHAQKRLDERTIHLNATEWTSSQEKLIHAKNKEITDSASVLKDAILVAITKNNTIVTAMPRGEEQVITNSNGTIILKD